MSALTPSLAPKEAWKTPKRKRSMHEKLESAAKTIGALRQLAPKKAWKAPEEKKAAHEKLIGNFRALKKDMQLKRPYPQKTPKKEELREIKDYFREKKERPKYAFAPPQKPTFTAKELDKKAQDIKKRLMERDKGESK